MKVRLTHLWRGLWTGMEVPNDAIARRSDEPGVFGIMQAPLQALQLILLLQVTLKGCLFPINPTGQPG